MADEHIRTPQDRLRPDPLPPDTNITRARVSSSQRPGEEVPVSENMEEDHPATSNEVLLFLRWYAGLLLVLCMGWGLIAVVGFCAVRGKIPLSMDVAAFIAGIISFFLFLLLERDLWLSRFMGLRLNPRSTPLKETIFLWLFGVPGLFVRSSTTAKPAPIRARSSGSLEKDSLREIVETVVFVVVLVLMLKTFVAEAFVIPTGSMATTLLGYHRSVTCPSCGFNFPVNISAEVDPQNRSSEVITGCTCPNCRLHISFDLQNQQTGVFP